MILLLFYSISTNEWCFKELEKGNFKDAEHNIKVQLKVASMIFKEHHLSERDIPEMAVTYFIKGLIHQQGYNNFDKAIEAFTESIEINPNVGDTYWRRGIDYLNKDIYDKAMEDFNEAIARDPSLDLAYYNRGYIYTKTGYYERSISDLSKAIELNPKYFFAYEARGLAYALKGLKEISCRDLRTACTYGECEVYDSPTIKGFCR